MPRLTLIHATRVAIDPIEKASREIWPEAETVSILEESLAVDREKHESLSAGLSKRIASLTRYAETIGSDGILFTCSAFGPAIDEAARNSSVPVMKPNEAMFGGAIQLGRRLAMIYTFAPAAEGMEAEFNEACKARGTTAAITSYFCDGAFNAKRAGNESEHTRLILETGRQIMDADAIMLAQFSMADAAEGLRSQTSIPVLTSPEAAITEIRKRMKARTRHRAC